MALAAMAVGLIAGGSGAALGSLAAWPIVALVFKFGWSVDWPALASVLAAVALLCATAGAAAGAAAALGRPGWWTVASELAPGPAAR